MQYEVLRQLGVFRGQAEWPLDMHPIVFFIGLLWSAAWIIVTIIILPKYKSKTDRTAVIVGCAGVIAIIWIVSIMGTIIFGMFT